MSRILLFIVLNSLVITVGAQSKKDYIVPLKMGDKLPNLPFELHRRDSVLSIHLGDYRGKLILLDYWSIHCPPCIAKMPSLLQLQEQFKNRMQIILYTKDKDVEIKKFWKTNKLFTTKVLDAAQQLPLISADTVLTELFPPKAFGLEVWIDSAQNFIASTYDPIILENIQALLNGQKVKFTSFLLPDMGPEDRDKWLNRRFNLADHLKLFEYTFFTNYDEKFVGVGSFFKEQFERDSITQKVIGVYLINTPILDLYKMAYFQKYLPDNKILLKVKHPENLIYVEGKSNPIRWVESHRFCFAMRISSVQPSNIFDLMKIELNRFFNLSSKIENRKIKCLVLKRISLNDKIHTKRLVNKSGFIQSGYDTRKLVIHNEPISVLFSYLYNDYVVRNDPFKNFIDETNYKKNIDIEIPWGEGKYSISALREELKKYDLDVVEEYRNIKLLVLRDVAVSLKSQ